MFQDSVGLWWQSPLLLPGITTWWCLGSFIILSMHSSPRFHGQRVITGGTRITASLVIRTDWHWIKPLMESINPSQDCWQTSLLFPTNTTLLMLIEVWLIIRQHTSFGSACIHSYWKKIIFYPDFFSLLLNSLVWKWCFEGILA